MIVDNMCSQDCTCMGCTGAFGQQLAGLFQLWTDMLNDTDDQIIHDIEASVNALRQLKIFLDQEKTSTAKIFTSAGHQDIEALTIKCNLIFKAIILIFQKATEKKDPDTTDSNGDVDRNTSVSGKVLDSISEKKRIPDEAAEETGNEKSPEEKSNLLVGPVPSLTSTKTMGLIGKLRDNKDWLESRMEPCEIQLRWIRKSLLLHVQMGRLTCLANQYGLPINPRCP